MKEALIELGALEEHLLAIGQEKKGRSMSGVSSPKLDQEITALQRQRLLLLEKINQSSRPPALTWPDQLNSALEDYGKKSGLQVKFVPKKHYSKEETDKSEMAKYRLDFLSGLTKPDRSFTIYDHFGQVLKVVQINPATQFLDQAKTIFPFEPLLQQPIQREEKLIVDVDRKESEEGVAIANGKRHEEEAVLTPSRSKEDLVKREVPEVSEIIQAEENYVQHCQSYIGEKKRARSIWRTFFSELRFLRGTANLSLDRQVSQASNNYELARNRYILLRTTRKLHANPQYAYVDQSPDALTRYQQALAKAAVDIQEKVENKFAEEEMQMNNKRISNFYYRHAGSAAVGGILATFAIGTGLREGLVAPNLAAGTALLSSTLFGVNNICRLFGEDIVTTFGKRKELKAEQAEQLSLPETEQRLAAFYERRVQEGRWLPTTSEVILKETYQKKLQDAIYSSLASINEDGHNLTALKMRLWQIISNRSTLKEEENKVLAKERNTEAFYWLLGGIVTLNLFTKVFPLVGKDLFDHLLHQLSFRKLV